MVPPSPTLRRTACYVGQGLRRAGSGFILREVQARKLAMVFASSGIVCVGGVEFGFETAESNSAAIFGNLGTPAFYSVRLFIKRYAFVSGGAAGFCFLAVAGIFGDGRDAEI